METTRQLQRPEPVPAGKRDPWKREQLLWVRFREPADLHLPQRVQLQLYLRQVGEPAENDDPEPVAVGEPIRGGQRNLLKTTYGNGDWWSYTYDNLDRLTKKKQRRRVQRQNTPTTTRISWYV